MPEHTHRVIYLYCRALEMKHGRRRRPCMHDEEIWVHKLWCQKRSARALRAMRHQRPIITSLIRYDLSRCALLSSVKLIRDLVRPAILRNGSNFVDGKRARAYDPLNLYFIISFAIFTRNPPYSPAGRAGESPRGTLLQRYIRSSSAN